MPRRNILTHTIAENFINVKMELLRWLTAPLTSYLIQTGIGVTLQRL